MAMKIAMSNRNGGAICGGSGSGRGNGANMNGVSITAGGEERRGGRRLGRVWPAPAAAIHQNRARSPAITEGPGVWNPCAASNRDPPTLRAAVNTVSCGVMS